MSLSRDTGRRGLVRAPRNLVGGLVLVLLAGVVLAATAHLSQGTMRAMGPAMFPRMAAIGLGACGLLIALSAFVNDGPALEPWNWRAAILVTASVLLFAATIRTVGFLVAAPLLGVVAGYATPEARGRELTVLVIALTVGGALLFRVLLDQPLPMLIAPGGSWRW